MGEQPTCQVCGYSVQQEHAVACCKPGCEGVCHRWCMPGGPAAANAGNSYTCVTCSRVPGPRSKTSLLLAKGGGGVKRLVKQRDLEPAHSMEQDTRQQQQRSEAMGAASTSGRALETRASDSTRGSSQDGAQQPEPGPSQQAGRRAMPQLPPRPSSSGKRPLPQKGSAAATAAAGPKQLQTGASPPQAEQRPQQAAPKAPQAAQRLVAPAAGSKPAQPAPQKPAQPGVQKPAQPAAQKPSQPGAKGPLAVHRPPPAAAAAAPKQTTAVSLTKQLSGGLKRPLPASSLPGAAPPKPAVRPRLEGGTQDLLASSLSGLRKESERHKAYKAESVHGPGGVDVESRSEQLLKQRAMRSHPTVSTAALQAQQKAVVAASLKEPALWQGELLLSAEADQAAPVKLSGYGIKGNAHAMDAAVKLPRGALQGTLLPAAETLEMHPVEAADNAALVLKGASPDDCQALARLTERSLLPRGCLVQVLLGEGKPLWVALLPGPDATLMAVFVRFAVKWTHSERRPEKGLLKKEGAGGSRRIRWPDHSRSTLRSHACERGNGPAYAHSFSLPEPSPVKAPEEQQPKQRPPPPPPGPLADMTVAIVGFQRDHDAIKSLRRSLKELGASTISNNAPWPGCVNVMVFPEQMVEQGIGLEDSAPREMPPAKEFLLAKGTRLFMTIDYPHACCRLKRWLTTAEEATYKIRELWPQGVHVLADADTLHAAALARPDPDGPSLLEQVLEQLQAAAQGAKPATIFALGVAPAHLAALRERESPAHALCSARLPSQRCRRLDEPLCHADMTVCATRAAHFFRWYCRHTVLLVRREDAALLKAAEERRTVHAVVLEQAPDFLKGLTA